MAEAQVSPWEEVSQLDLRGRVFHREEAGDEIYGMMSRVEVKGDSFKIIDDAKRVIASGSVSMGSCSVEGDGKIRINVYTIGAVYIYPRGTHLKPA